MNESIDIINESIEVVKNSTNNMYLKMMINVIEDNEEGIITDEQLIKLSYLCYQDYYE